MENPTENARWKLDLYRVYPTSRYQVPCAIVVEYRLPGTDLKMILVVIQALKLAFWPV